MASDNHAKIVWINVAAFVEHNTFLKKVLFIKILSSESTSKLL